jgi:MFS family permease
MIIRFLAWRWQFYFNIPLAVIGIVAAWYVLDDAAEQERKVRIDWLGAGLLTVALVALNLALLGPAEIQSVTGLEQLTGGSRDALAWFYPVAIVTGLGFVWWQRRVEDPLIDPGLFRGRNLLSAVGVNFLVGATLAIAMVNVPLFINVVELNLERAAVTTGWVLSALTASMSVASYVGGRVTESRWYRPPVLIGLTLASAAFLLMGYGWDADTSYWVMAAELGLLGVGFGLVMAPTTAAVVDYAPADRRGTAASLVMVLRLIGLSVGLSGLTAWGLYRFNQLRTELDLPSLNDPDYADLVTEASADLTAAAMAETFVAAGFVLVVAWLVAWWMRRSPHQEVPLSDDQPAAEGVPMQMNRNLIIGAGIVIVTLTALTLLLFSRVSSLSDDLAASQERQDQLEETMLRVEGGAALYAAQMTGFQEQLGDLGPTIDVALGEAVVGIDQFRTSTIRFDVSINETVPINTEVVLNRTLQVPIRTVLPIDEEFETTIRINGPFGIDIPLDITVPINLDLPIDLTVAIPVNERIPVNTEVPVNLDVPIEIDISETELATLAEALAQGLESFRQMALQLGG